jgi:hypothetical protein
VVLAALVGAPLLAAGAVVGAVVGAVAATAVEVVLAAVTDGGDADLLAFEVLEQPVTINIRMAATTAGHLAVDACMAPRAFASASRSTKIEDDSTDRRPTDIVGADGGAGAVTCGGTRTPGSASCHLLMARPATAVESSTCDRVFSLT